MALPAGRSGSYRRPNPNIDEDYTDKPAKGKGRSISRFGAEHKQRAEQVGGSTLQALLLA
jgi:hypothetical protein